MGTRRNLFSALALCLGLVAALAACQMDYSGSVMGTSRELHLKYTAFNTTEAQALDLEAGDEIAVSVVSQEGAVSIAIQKEGAHHPGLHCGGGGGRVVHRDRHRQRRRGQRGCGGPDPGVRPPAAENFPQHPHFDGKNGGKL